jgi:TolB-like protein/Tfp pilus assembly protein PilF
MASLIPGFEYDVFISYRQKDNKHDGWVSKFVDNLKGELEAIIKEDVSVYFDENPHDRLQETYNVDKSLEGKLKCLIFIPILSKTYCDTSSYAWQYEFLAFLRITENDRFGRDVRLRGGNVASRILPIKIHDLEQEDIKLFEKETGSVLRAMDFVFKTATGVNRPLKANEDHPQDNFNKTFYSDQINKVANAIDEIIHSLKERQPGPSDRKLSSEQVAYGREENKAKDVSANVMRTKKSKRFLIISFSVLISVVGLLAMYKFIAGGKQVQKLSSEDKSIAVLPFRYLGDDTAQIYFCDGFMEELLNNLQKIRNFTVRSRTSSDQYRNTKKSITSIGTELNVNYLIEGSVGREGNNLKIWVQLIDSKADKHLWSNEYLREMTVEQIFSLQSEIARAIATELKTVLTPDEIKKIEKRPTENLGAYNLYLQGRFFWSQRTKEGLKKSAEYFEKALAIDPVYALVYAGLADAYFIQAFWGWIPSAEGIDKARENASKALEIDKDLAEAHTVMGALLEYSDWKFEGARKELVRAIELNPNYAVGHQYYAELLHNLDQFKEARLQLNIALELDPFYSILYHISAYYYYDEGKLKESLDEFHKLVELFPQLRVGNFLPVYIYMKQGEDLKAVETLQQIMSLDTLTSKNANTVKEIYSESGKNGLLNILIELEFKKPIPCMFNIAKFYAMLSKKEEALKYLEKSRENKEMNFIFLNSDPDFDNMRSDPRFKKMIKDLGLSEYSKKE